MLVDMFDSGRGVVGRGDAVIAGPHAMLALPVVLIVGDAVMLSVVDNK